jgi:hypothetical protein
MTKIAVPKWCVEPPKASATKNKYMDIIEATLKYSKGKLSREELLKVIDEFGVNKKPIIYDVEKWLELEGYSKNINVDRNHLANIITRYLRYYLQNT